MSGDTEFTPTDEDVRAAWTAWSDPGDDRWTPERYDQWLAAHDERVRAEAAERAWREGYYTGKRDYAGSITGGMPISTPNPYERRES